jgi:hypothetical protein
MPQLGQFVPSHISEVEHVEEEQNRTLRQEIVERDRLLEGPPKSKTGCRVAHLEAPGR